MIIMSQPMIEIVTGDITTRREQAIVNSANPELVRGGGVCGAIFLAAGADLEAECRTYGGCPVGGTVITTGCDLFADYIIHAVAPPWAGGTRNEDLLLRQCYRSIFRLVAEHKIMSVAIPALGTGIYGYPLREAAKISIEETRAAQDMNAFQTVFVCFDTLTFAAFYEANRG